MMRVAGGNTLIHTAFGRFVISANGEIRRQPYNEPISDKYGNVLDNENRTMANAAGDTIDFRSDASEGMILNNGSVAFNGEFGSFEQVQVMEFENFKVLGYVEGHLNTSTCVFRYMDEIMQPLDFDMTYFTTKFVFDMISINTISEYNIVAHGAECETRWELKIITNEGFDTGIIFALTSISNAFNIYIYENFLITFNSVEILDNLTASHKLECIYDSVYLIKNKGRLTKAAVHESAIYE